MKPFHIKHLLHSFLYWKFLPLYTLCPKTKLPCGYSKRPVTLEPDSFFQMLALWSFIYGFEAKKYACIPYEGHKKLRESITKLHAEQQSSWKGEMLSMMITYLKYFHAASILFDRFRSLGTNLLPLLWRTL